MYRVVLVREKKRTPLPKSEGDQGRLFERRRQAVKFGKELSQDFPGSRFEIESYGPLSPYDWVICDSCKSAARVKTIGSNGGCWRCNGSKIISGPNPPWWRKLRALCNEGLER
jgi:hypothetical protein